MQTTISHALHSSSLAWFSGSTTRNSGVRDTHYLTEPPADEVTNLTSDFKPKTDLTDLTKRANLKLGTNVWGCRWYACWMNVKRLKNVAMEVPGSLFIIRQKSAPSRQQTYRPGPFKKINIFQFARLMKLQCISCVVIRSGNVVRPLYGYPNWFKLGYNQSNNDLRPSGKKNPFIDPHG